MKEIKKLIKKTGEKSTEDKSGVIIQMKKIDHIVKNQASDISLIHEMFDRFFYVDKLS